LLVQIRPALLEGLFPLAALGVGPLLAHDLKQELPVLVAVVERLRDLDLRP
jgi:hypothetical protein